MVLTCGTCGHRGEEGKDYNHDCYWVFVERGRALSARLPAAGREIDAGNQETSPAPETKER